MPLKTPIPIGQNIRRIREMRGLTQLQLAHKMGWTGQDAGSTISQYENNLKTPWVETLEKMAEALEVQMGQFLLPAKAGKAVNGKEGK